jgi:hypothetical protein
VGESIWVGSLGAGCAERDNSRRAPHTPRPWAPSGLFWARPGGHSNRSFGLVGPEVQNRASRPCHAHRSWHGDLSDADHRIAGHQRRELFFRHGVRAGGTLEQDEASDFGGGIPRPAPDFIGQVQYELSQNSAGRSQSEIDMQRICTRQMATPVPARDKLSTATMCSP